MKIQPKMLTLNIKNTPFGTILDGRAYGILGRIGFNGKENDDEIKGGANSLDFGSRIYDPRIGRFLSVDPFAKKYPTHSAYILSQNSPMKILDYDGNDIIVAGDFSTVGNNGRSGLDLFTSTKVGTTFLAQFVRMNDQNVQQGNYSLPNASSNGILSQHTINFETKSVSGKSSTGQTTLQLWDKESKSFVNYEGQNITKDVQFRINIFATPLITQNGTAGANAMNISHESFLHAEAIAKILVEFEIYKKANPNTSETDLNVYLKKQLTPYLDEGRTDLGEATEDLQHATSADNTNYNDAQKQIVEKVDTDPSSTGEQKQATKGEMDKMKAIDKKDQKDAKGVKKLEKKVQALSPK